MSLEHMALPFWALSRVQGLFVCRAVSNGTGPPRAVFPPCMTKALPREPCRAPQPPWAEGLLCMPGPVPSEAKSCLLSPDNRPVTQALWRGGEPGLEVQGGGP